MSASLDLERQTLDSVQQWLQGATWFALEDGEGFAVIACSDLALARFVEEATFPTATTPKELAAVAACRAFFGSKDRPHGRLAIASGMCVHFGTRAALRAVAASSAEG